jgi:hypothetical protein
MKIHVPCRSCGQAPAPFKKQPLLRRRWLLSLALVMLLPLAAVAQMTNCAWSGVERILAIGDVHGDYDRLVELLRAGGAVDKENKWIGGKMHLVQTGDVIDRGPGSKPAMDLLKRLETEAADAGGRVHALIGNHEAMANQGNTSDAHPEELKSYDGTAGFKMALGPDGEYGRWIRKHNAVIRINDTLFLHGGISPNMADKSLLELNEAVRAALAQPSGWKKSIMGDDGPLWYRGNAVLPKAELEKELAATLPAFQASRVVIGHTISKKGIQSRGDGQVIMIDVGFSKTYVNNPPAALLIESNKLFIVTPTGTVALALEPEEKRPKKNRP